MNPNILFSKGPAIFSRVKHSGRKEKNTRLLKYLDTFDPLTQGRRTLWANRCIGSLIVIVLLNRATASMSTSKQPRMESHPGPQCKTVSLYGWVESSHKVNYSKIILEYDMNRLKMYHGHFLTACLAFFMIFKYFNNWNIIFPVCIYIFPFHILLCTFPTI